VYRLRVAFVSIHFAKQKRLELFFCLFFVYLEGVHDRPSRSYCHPARRVMAFLCVLAILIAGMAAQLHKHDAAQDASCLVCHAVEHATIVAIAADAGKAWLSEQESAPMAKVPTLTLPDASAASAPRAPPSLVKA
jgi:hypothetical protein